MTISLYAAKTPREACAHLARSAQATAIAGGTLVMNALNTSDIATASLVDLDGLGLRRIKINGTQVTFGAMTTMADIIAHARLGFLAPVARAIGGPAVRNMATIGGNLHAESPYGDFGVALLALDAKVTIETARQKKTMALEDFYKQRGRLGAHVLTAVTCKIPPRGSFAFVKAIRRHPVSAAVLSIAAVLPLKNGKLVEPRIAYGAMAPTPVRAKPVEAALAGKPLDTATIAKAVALAGQGTTPETDAYASAWYRREVLPVHLARLLATRLRGAA
jgi:CO/xanthine dehydrogenase FAD-binding subunit